MPPYRHRHRNPFPRPPPREPPVYPTLPAMPNQYGRPPTWPGLRVDGLVRRPRTFTASQLAELTARALTADFQCQEGWTTPAQRWEGVPLPALLQLAGALPAARWVSIAAGDYAAAVPLDGTEADLLLATRLNSAPLPAEHGGPCRLVGAGQVCYASVKWVAAITLSAQRPPDTARTMAQARNAATAATR